MLNRVILIGNLGADPDVKYPQSGETITNIRLATSSKWKDKQTGEQREKTEWHRVVFFNIGNYKLADIAGEYLKKGSKIYVEGRLQTRKWTDKDGKDQYTTEIVGEQMFMLDSKDKTDDIGYQQPTQQYQSVQQPAYTAAPPPPMQQQQPIKPNGIPADAITQDGGVSWWITVNGAWQQVFPR